MENTQEKLLLEVDEACAALRISRSSLYRIFRKKKLKSLRLGSRRLVRKEELLRFVEALESK